MEREVLFQAKSLFPKNDCPFCGNVATLEAVCKVSENKAAIIRCCEKEECQKKAAKFTRLQAEALALL